MKWNLFCVTICAYLAATLSAPPVFLESAGSRICTLNKVGKIPTGTAIKFPVYQKVCRHVIPKLGDEVNDADELNAEDETVSTGDDEVDVIRRAILGATKRSLGKQQKNSKISEVNVVIPKSAFDIAEPFKITAVVSN